jgi:tRNA-specific 2-thiouridylase
MKALALLSGGLDSILAAKVVQEAGIEVEAIHFLIPFIQTPDNPTGEGEGTGKVANAAKQLNIKLHYYPCGEDYLQMIQKPDHGYGKRMNPCLDCRIYTFKLAAQKMAEIGAAFLISGEVIDQRPNSQRSDALDITSRDAGLKGLVLRPLSAQLLRPTIPEEQGWIDRSRLLGIKGRGRNEQIHLAAKYGITHYPSPAGGCLLTNQEYSLKVKDLLEHKINLTMDTIQLLRIGRHLRLSPEVKIIVGKDHTENETLKKLTATNHILLELADFAGPITMVIGTPKEDMLRLAAAITAGYGSQVPAGSEIKVNVSGTVNTELFVKSLSREAIRDYFIYAV